tara:strand:+ start:179 stop:358 length:180 start_codon:yes stop_codon:yes gene_type:complete
MRNLGQAFWAVLIALNTVFIINNIVIDQLGYAAINFVAALCCWAGYFRSSAPNKEEKEK